MLAAIDRVRNPFKEQTSFSASNIDCTCLFYCAPSTAAVEGASARSCSRKQKGTKTSIALRSVFEPALQLGSPDLVNVLLAVALALCTMPDSKKRLQGQLQPEL